MKRFFGLFELTVAEQRVVIVLLFALVVLATWRTSRGTQPPPANMPEPIATPSATPAE